MKTSVAITKQLRAMEFPEKHTRELRALFVAQVAAYQVPLKGELELEAQLERHLPDFKALLNGVNEFLPLDIKLANNYFYKLLKARIALINGVEDIALLKAALNSDTQDSQLDFDDMTLVDILVSLSGFGNAMAAVTEACKETEE